MKVLVYGMPRTCTTVCCQLLSQSLALPNLLEQYASIRQQQNRQAADDFLQSQNQYVAKILTIDCLNKNHFRYEPFPWHWADRVVITSRENYTHQICSDYFAREVAKYSKPMNSLDELAQWREFLKTITITVPLEYINKGSLVDHQRIFQEGCEHIRSIHPNSTHEVTYEDFQLSDLDSAQKLSDKLWFQVNSQTLTLINQISQIRHNPDYTRQVLNYQELNAAVQRALA